MLLLDDDGDDHDGQWIMDEDDHDDDDADDAYEDGYEDEHDEVDGRRVRIKQLR